MKNERKSIANHMYTVLLEKYFFLVLLEPFLYFFCYFYFESDKEYGTFFGY